MQPINPTIAERMQERGLTLVHLAALTGMSVARLCELRQENRLPKNRLLRATVAQVLGIEQAASCA